MPPKTPEQRAAARADWPVRRTTLGAATTEPAASVSERLAMMWSLTVDVWRLTGRPMPDYTRANAPVEVRRLRPG